jgi:hypothetical protein
MLFQMVTFASPGFTYPLLSLYLLLLYLTCYSSRFRFFNHTTLYVWENFCSKDHTQQPAQQNDSRCTVGFYQKLPVRYLSHNYLSAPVSTANGCRQWSVHCGKRFVFKRNQHSAADLVQHIFVRGRDGGPETGHGSKPNCGGQSLLSFMDLRRGRNAQNYN